MMAAHVQSPRSELFSVLPSSSRPHFNVGRNNSSTIAFQAGLAERTGLIGRFAQESWRTLRHMTFAERVRDCVTKPEENWNRFSSYLDTSAFKRPSDIWDVSSD